MDLPALGRALRLRRQELDKTLAEVGRSAGCTRQNVHKVEHALSNPTLQTLDRITEALDLRLEMALVDSETPAWPADDRDLLRRARVESRIHRLARQTPAGQLDALEARLAELEEAFQLPTGQLERVRVLSALLEDAGIAPDVAAEVAASEADLPSDWEQHPARFARIFDRARQRMAS